VHSFTPVLAGEVRTCDIGLLYDPRREAEGKFAEAWRKGLAERLPGFRIRKNYPYRGAADGFTTYLRKQFPRSYLGIELELNQKHVGTRHWSDLELALTATLAEFLQR
jgi:predicted N-formylglutamate amidohydrolase